MVLGGAPAPALSRRRLPGIDDDAAAPTSTTSVHAEGRHATRGPIQIQLLEQSPALGG